MAKYLKAILFYNSKAGHSKADSQKRMITNHFQQKNIDLAIIDVPKPQAEIDETIQKGISEGVDLFIAAGGDGTVSMISHHLVGTPYPLGIIPLGTGNLIAQELELPLRIEKALERITSDDHTIALIDTFKLEDRYYISNVSVGVSPEIMRETDSQEKQRIGVFAYLAKFIKQILGLQLQEVTIDYDSQKTTVLASEVLLTNIKIAGIDPLVWSDDISLTDGVLDLLVFRAASLMDILGLLFSVFAKKGKRNPVVKFLQVRDYCRITSSSPMQIQADGDLVGKTPFTIHIIPKSLNIIGGKKI